MRVLVARPNGPGPFPAVILYHHVGGLTDTMRLMADRVAAGGYACFAPDLYHRLGTIVLDPQSADPDVAAIRRIAAASVTDGNALADTVSLLEWLETRPGLLVDRLGTLGFGRGGSLAVSAACAFPERVRAAASVLGFGFATDGKAATRARLARASGGLYFAFAGKDDIIPAAVPAELAALLDGLALDTRLVVHPGTSHPYIFPDRTVHDPAAAARDWDAILAMYARHIGNSAQNRKS